MRERASLSSIVGAEKIETESDEMAGTTNQHQHHQRRRSIDQRHQRANITSSTMKTATLPLLLLLLIITLLLPHPTTSQASLSSNDPDSLCTSKSTSQKYTGYKSTLDCRGYVYCADGYLMGGGASTVNAAGVSGGSGVIACWPNMLYDERSGTCSQWQQVDTSDCPLFESGMMMPDQYDGNANPERFFCGSSSSNAKRVCEACPGGSRLECSDPTHNCFANIRGCPTESKPAPTPPTAAAAVNGWYSTNVNNDEEDVNNWGDAIQYINNDPPQPVPIPATPPPTRRPTRWPTKYPTRMPVPRPTDRPTNRPFDNVVGIQQDGPPSNNNIATFSTTNNNNNNNNNVANNNSNNNNDNDNEYLHGRLRSSYYCGFSWGLTVNGCPNARPCPGGLNDECEVGQTCFPDTPCATLRTSHPTPKPSPRPISEEEHKNYCGYDWDWVINNCHQAIPCPYSDASGVCPNGMKCIGGTPCHHMNNGMPTPNPSRFPTKRPSSPPVEEDDSTKRYCGYDWADVTENCLYATPCPGGVAQGTCPYEMNCIAETLCTDEGHLEWLRNKQSSIGSGQSFGDMSPAYVPPPTPPVAEGRPSPAFIMQAVPNPPPTFRPTNRPTVRLTPRPTRQPVRPPTRRPIVPPTPPTVSTNGRCTSSSDCTAGLFCNRPIAISGQEGYCGECLSNGFGCSTEELCRSTACHNNQTPGPTKCYKSWEMDQDCQGRLNDAGAKCNLDGMICLASQDQQQQQQQQGMTGAKAEDTNQGSVDTISLTTMYENPAGNTFFCGLTFLVIKDQCLQSKPCPSGFASKFCATGEGCFSVATCVAEYESASVVSSLPLPIPPPTQNPSKQPTGVPTRNPTSYPTKRPILMPTPYNPAASSPSMSTSMNDQQDSQQQSGSTTISSRDPVQQQKPVSNSSNNTPLSQPTLLSTTTTTTATEPTTALPSKAPTINTNYCGTSWEDHVQNCATSRPCPKGDECWPGESCFNDSPCVAMHGPEDLTSNEGSFCGSEWNVLMSTCMSATRCPNGDECAEGEFCYKNFVCNPRPTPNPTPTTITQQQQQQPKPQTTAGSNNNNNSTPLTSSKTTPQPSTLGTSTPSKAPVINTNFCGTSWQDHTQNCASSVPCPRGDECGLGEQCFSGSPCVVVNNNSLLEDGDNNIQFESNVGSYCGTEWNVLLTKCMSATRCPIGNECAEGEFCYRDYACDPPPSASPTVTITSPPSSAPSKKPTPLPIGLATSTSTSTRPPSKSPVINTNFCGTSWEDHAKNCAGSRPCPRGDECAVGESCFQGSPCSPLGGDGNENDAESNVGSFCGNGWNELMSMCETATKCPIGDECADGQFCYRDFVCDPPKIPDPPVILPNPNSSTETETGATVPGTETMSTTVNALASVFAQIEQSASNKGDGGSGTTESNSKPTSGGDGSLGGSGSGTTVGQSNPQGQLSPDESCSICGSSQLDWSKHVDYDGKDISCGEFGWIFQSQNVAEGSNQCLNFRALYFGHCCYTRPTGNGCDLCDTGIDGHWHDIRENVSVEFDGEQSSCAEVSNKLRTRYNPTDNQCMDEKNEHFDECCFKKCNLCGDSNIDWEATVYYSGEEVICHELDSKIFVEEGISSESSRCEMSQSFYAGSCCIQAPEKPCDLCRSRTGDHFNMNTNARVSYDGEMKTCLEVYHSLYARREQSSDHCITAQGGLFDQCCEAFDNYVGATGQDDTTVEEALSTSPTVAPTTQKPTPDIDSWYAGSMTRSSPATTTAVSFWSLYPLLAVGLITILC